VNAAITDLTTQSTHKIHQRTLGTKSHQDSLNKFSEDSTLTDELTSFRQSNVNMLEITTLEYLQTLNARIPRSASYAIKVQATSLPPHLRNIKDPQPDGRTNVGDLAWNGVLHIRLTPGSSRIGLS